MTDPDSTQLDGFPTWEFYLARVDDAAASLRFDLSLRTRAPLPTAPVLYWCNVEMLDPAAHGMGSGAEADDVKAREHDLLRLAIAAAFHPVGVLRNLGNWQFTFYGPADRDAAFAAVVRAALEGDARATEVGAKADADWSYYREFLLPDEERWQWILDRRMVWTLAEQGDDATRPRPVDHRARFVSQADRDAFATAIEALDFRVVARRDDARGDARPLGLHFRRDDPVDLEAIHAVVMELHQLLRRHHGSYDGWSAPAVAS